MQYLYGEITISLSHRHHDTSVPCLFTNYLYNHNVQHNVYLSFFF